ncbi:MAG: hypothetical protein AB7K24_25625 [Gemmataceae bacterium]
MVPRKPLDLSQLKMSPLASRHSLTRADDILIDPDTPPQPLDELACGQVRELAGHIRAAREQGRSIMLIYGAHLLRNGAARLVDRLLADGWLNHLATNGAGSIHDWEYAWLGASTESVADGIAHGCFGTWNETGRFLHLALLVGGITGEGYGQSLGRFLHEDGVTLPHAEGLKQALRDDPEHPLSGARADLLRAMNQHGLTAGRHQVEHRWKHASIIAQAYARGVPVTVHPGIGYDIIATHPMFTGAAIGRAAEIDFKLFAAAVEGLDDGVVLNVGSAIMGPQVFEKSLSCVNNLRLQAGRPVVSGHQIVVVDLQDGGQWDWRQGEPPKTNPAYYLRFCKSFSRMGGAMHYVQADNVTLLHHLYGELKSC